MTRREARETAFLLLFEKTFSSLTMEDIVQFAGETRDLQADDFVISLAEGAARHIEKIDAEISIFSHNWQTNRISRVAMTVMRLAVYEMWFEQDIPVSVSINEAVELSKKYGGEEDAAFINGVLGGIARKAPEKLENPDPAA
ncbi:MAG: transcription antitermination factor NusB [Oscillospiraceae bacterium]|nr:transcription antitermination factor NusB [Oscillospiraceae bacterium]